MMAQVIFDNGDTLDLDERGRWSSRRHGEIARSLNNMQGGSFQEWNGDGGHSQAHEAADLFGGVVRINRKRR